MVKKIARDKHPRLVIISLKVVSFTSLLDIPKKKKSSILWTWYATIVFLRSRCPLFFLIHFLFLTKLWAACVQNHTNDDDEKTKSKNPHRYISWGIFSSTFMYNLSPLFLGGWGGVIYQLVEQKKTVKSHNIMALEKVRPFCQPTNSRTLYSIKSPSFLLRAFHFFSWRNSEPFVFSDDEEENKIKKD